MSEKRVVFVIEGDHDTRVKLRGILEAEGYSVSSAANGRDALEQLAKAGPPGLILLGWSLPVMTDQELLRQLRADTKLANVPVLKVSEIPKNGSGKFPDAKALVDSVRKSIIN